jgi:hypothetical protein
MKINGKEIQAIGLSYGAVKANGDLLDNLTATGKTNMERVAASVDLLKLALPELTDEDIDATAPGSLLSGALAIYQATFSRPEDLAPEAKA